MILRLYPFKNSNGLEGCRISIIDSLAHASDNIYFCIKATRLQRSGRNKGLRQRSLQQPLGSWSLLMPCSPPLQFVLCILCFPDSCFSAASLGMVMVADCFSKGQRSVAICSGGGNEQHTFSQEPSDGRGLGKRESPVLFP